LKRTPSGATANVSAKWDDRTTDARLFRFRVVSVLHSRSKVHSKFKPKSLLFPFLRFSSYELPWDSHFLILPF
jgi:hypothetical protein